jgi:apolipoprotein N-acyltransferase
MHIKNSTRLAMTVGGGLITALPWWDFPGILLLVSFIPLLLVEEDVQKKDEGLPAVLFYSFGFFITWNIIVTWWLARIHLIGGISVILLNSALMSLVFMLYSAIKKGTGSGAGILVILWTGFEYLHHSGDLSWPWLSLGNGLAVNAAAVQWYEYTGMTGGTLWVLLVNVMLLAVVKPGFWHGKGKQATVFGVILPVILIALPYAVSLHIYRTWDPAAGRYSFLILQPVADPYGDKFSGRTNEQRLDQLLELARKNIYPGIDFIVTPETSVDSIWITDPGNEILGRFREFSSEYPGTGLIVGATTFSSVGCGEQSFTTRINESGELYEVQNSVVYFERGEYSGVYHKHHLANGVEQVPFQEFFSFLRWFSVDLEGVSGSMKAGPGAEVLVWPHHDSITMASLICFESSYGNYAAGMVVRGAEIIVVLSNDGWFRDTGAYRQHLRLSRIRAVETRRDIVRAANTGISCHITSRGDITGSLGWWEQGAVVVHAAANNEKTFYVRSGDFTGRAALFFSFLLILNLAVRKLHLK